MKKITKFLLALAAIIWSGSSFAQFSATWLAQYQHTVSPGFSNEARKVVEDASGNIFVLADVTSDVDPAGFHGTGTYHYITLTKYSTTGSVLNSANVNIQKHIYSGFDNLSAFGLEVDASGNVYAGYSFWGSALNNFDIALTKFSNTLTRLWSNTYSTPGDDLGVDMKLQSTGVLFAVVKSINATTDYTVIKTVPSNSPAVVVYTFPSSSAVINSLALNGSQNAFVAGYSTKGVWKNAYVASITLATSTLAWASIYTPLGYTGDDVANNVTVGIDGNVYTVGTTFQGLNAGKQVFVLKNQPANPRFDFVSVFGYPTVDDEGLFINASENGWLYVGSVSSNYLSTVYRLASSGGGAMNPTKASFGIVPGSPYTAVTGLTMTAMRVSSSKNIYITGEVMATGPSGSYSSAYLNKASVVFGNALIKVGGMPVEGDFDHNLKGVDLSLDYAKTDVYWLRSFWNDSHSSEIVELIDVNVPAPLRSTAPDNFADKNALISITPNPASANVTINADENINNIEILDITGNRVLAATAATAQLSLDVSMLTPGIYFCKIHTESTEIVRRLVIK